MFRDRDELAGGFDLEERVQTALRQSRFLIVICSPHAVASSHVRQEIEYFESLDREAQVICLIVGGEPGASVHPAGAAMECLPVPRPHAARCRRATRALRANRGRRAARQGRRGERKVEGAGGDARRLLRFS